MEPKIIVHLHNIEDVKNFVKQAGRLNGEAYAISGRYTIDAKSLMGLFSLDLTQDIEIRCPHSTHTELTELFGEWEV